MGDEADIFRELLPMLRVRPELQAIAADPSSLSGHRISDLVAWLVPPGTLGPGTGKGARMRRGPPSNACWASMRSTTGR
jgi:hypothetical protein